MSDKDDNFVKILRTNLVRRNPSFPKEHIDKLIDEILEQEETLTLSDLEYHKEPNEEEPDSEESSWVGETQEETTESHVVEENNECNGEQDD